MTPRSRKITAPPETIMPATAIQKLSTKKATATHRMAPAAQVLGSIARAQIHLNIFIQSSIKKAAQRPLVNKTSALIILAV
jgi:hypothetical protein